MAVCVVLGATLVVALAIQGSVAHPTRAAKSPHAPVGTGARLVDPVLVTGYLAGAASDIAAITSYDYRTLDDALNAGLSVTTGAYQKSYRAALTGGLAAAATRNRRVQTFDLSGVGIGAISQDGASAKVLAFGVEMIKLGAGGGGTRADAVTLTATIRHRGGRYLISDLEVGANPGLPPGTAPLTVAAEAARSEVVNLLSYRHEHVDIDVDRALGGAVEPLRSEITGNVADTKASITKGNYDLAGTVSAIAVERADGDTVVLLVAATGNRVASDGTLTVVTDGRYEVTVVRVGGTWLTSEVSPVSPS